MRSCREILCLFMFLASVVVTGCSSSKDETSEETELEYESEEESARTSAILLKAKEEQLNKMYARDSDTTYLYWLDNEVVHLSGSTKCNIFAINVLHKAGYKTPSVNCRTFELFDTALFTEEFSVVSINSAEDAIAGDLIVWNGHVILFERFIRQSDGDYAYGWWAGTGKEDNGENVINNVCHGKYRLEGDYIVRRPVKKK